MVRLVRNRQGRLDRLSHETRVCSYRLLDLSIRTPAVPTQAAVPSRASYMQVVVALSHSPGCRAEVLAVRSLAPLCEMYGKQKVLSCIP